MIGVKAIKIILPFAYSLLCEYGFSALTEIKSKKRETSCNWRLNAGVFGNDGTSFQSLFVPENRHTIALIFWKQLCFVVSVPRIFFIFLVPRKLKKFENHCSAVWNDNQTHMRVRDWWKNLNNHGSNWLTSENERECEKQKQQLSQHQICRRNIKHQQFLWKHQIWC